MTRTSLPIAVVGGGPAGCSTAIHLAALAEEASHRLVVFERASFPRDKPCGGGLTALAVAFVQSFDPAILARPDSTWIESAVVVADRRVEHARLRSPMCVIHRRVFDDLLMRRARAAGIEIRESAEIGGVTTSGGRIAVQCAQDDFEVSAVVGADGAQGVVRRVVDPDRGGLARLIEVTTADRMDQAPQLRSTVIFDFSGVSEGLQGYAWRFPSVVDGVPSINWGVFDSRIYQDAARADLGAVLEAFMDAHGYSSDRSSWVSHPVRRFEPDAKLAAPGAILVGDAAGVDPALGEGLSLALDYGDLAAHAIVDAVAADEFSFADYRQRMLRHPVGQSLLLRHRMALEMYRPGAGPHRALELVTRWIASSS